ncbi:MAG: S8 family serine peptidase [Candidatus Aenigmatarchaeota archaeon]
MIFVFSASAYAISVDKKIIDALDNNSYVSVIVMMKKEPLKAKIAIALTADELKNKRDFNALNGYSGKISKKGLSKLLNDPRVASIQLDKPVHISLNDSVPIVNATQTWLLQINGTNITGRGETVCVIDTGINYNNTNLGGGWGNRVLSGYNYCADELCTVTSNDPYDNNGHGTHVAGIIASSNDTYRGVAYEANLIAIKALNSAGSGYDSDVISGINWCVNNATTFNISVISMSLGGNITYNAYCDNIGTETAYSIAINTAVANNISVIVASGNDASSTGISSPACIQNVTSVGSVTKSDVISSFSNRNNITDLLSPGSNVKSTVPASACTNCDSSGFKILSGTSMATPHVAGAFALLRQYKRLDNGTLLRPSEIEAALRRTGVNITDSVTGLIFPRISIYNAIVSLDTIKPVVSISSPANRTYNTTNISLSYSASDNIALAACLFTNTTGSSAMLGGCTNATFITAANQQNNITLAANDSNGNINSTRIFFTIDTTAPFINVTDPQNTSYTTTNITLNYSVADLQIDRCWFTNVTGSAIFLNGQSRGACTNVTFLARGNIQNNITVYVNDTGGNVNSSVIFFTTNLPYIISIQQPQNTTYNRNTSLELNFTIENNNSMDRIWYNIDNGNNNTVTSNTLFNTSEGHHILTLSVNSTLTSMNFTNVSFTVDITPPLVVFSSPQNKTYNSTTISVNYTSSDNILIDKCVMEWLNQTATNISLDGCQNITITFPAGSNYVKLLVNDSAGNTNYTAIYFTINLSAPAISLQSPVNLTYATTNISLNYTVSKFDTCWLINTTGQRTNISGCVNATFEATANQQNNITLFVNDSGGNLNSSQVFFTVDTTSPFVNFTSPTPNNQTFNNTNDIIVNVTLSEVPFAVLLEWNGTNKTMSGSGLVWFYAFNDISDGNYTFRVIANDTAGNFNVTSFRWVYVNATRNFTSYINTLNASLASDNVTMTFLNTTGVGDASSVFVDANYTLELNISNIIAEIANFSWSDVNTSNFVNVTRNITITNVSMTFNNSGGTLDNYVWIDMNNFTSGNYTPRVTFNGIFRVNYYLNGSRTNPSSTRINETCNTNSSNRPCYSIIVNTTSIVLLSFSGAAVGNDTQAPTLSISSPSGSYTTSSVSLGYSVSDNVGLDRCWYKLNSGPNVSLTNCANTTITAAEGSNTIILYTNDTTGNINSSSVSFTYSAPVVSSSGGGGGGGFIVRTNKTNTNQTNTTINNQTNTSSVNAANLTNLTTTSNQTAAINQAHDKEKMVCAQVITTAVKDEQCISYPTPCQVPKGWTVVSQCPEIKDEKTIFENPILLQFLFLLFLILT